MRTRRLLPTCFTLVAFCFTGDWARGGYAPVGPEELEMKVELVSLPPFPFQPVRLRLILRNVSKKRLGPVGPVSYRDPLIRGPRDDRYQPSRASVPFRGTTAASARETMNQRAPLYLDPGEQTSVAFALGVRRGEPGVPAPAPKAADIILLPEPGEYWLKCAYRNIEKEFKVEVRQPQGDDRAVYEVLRKNLPLAAALLEGAHPPDAALVPKIEAILELFPESSYAGYARFALARFYLKGNGYPDFGTPRLPSGVTRVDLAKAATQLERVFQGQLASAYYPNALIAMQAADPRYYEINMIAGKMVDRYPDSVEFLEVFAWLLATGDPLIMEFGELITGRKYPTAKDASEQQRFKAEVWNAYRKRVPAGLK